MDKDKQEPEKNLRYLLDMLAVAAVGVGQQDGHPENAHIIRWQNEIKDLFESKKEQWQREAREEALELTSIIILEDFGTESWADGHGTNFWEYRLPSVPDWSIRHYDNDLNTNKKYHCWNEETNESFNTESLTEAITYLTSPKEGQ